MKILKIAETVEIIHVQHIGDQVFFLFLLLGFCSFLFVFNHKKHLWKTQLASKDFHWLPSEQRSDPFEGNPSWE